MSIVDLARDERREFAEYLSTLTPEQWEAPSLCTGWSVRDVVAHVYSYEELGFVDTLKRFAAGIGRPGGPNAIGVEEYNKRSPVELVSLAKDSVTPRGLTTGFGCRIALTDCLIHHQDIRRALDTPREVPRERVKAVLLFALLNPVVHGIVPTRGLRLVATDFEWSFGFGPEVRGPGEALLMAMAGRRGVAGELAGPGQPTLASRIDG